MRKIVDLTYPIHEGMTTFPVHWHPAVEISILGRHGIENRETRKLLLGTHTGTHLDAPRHFVPGGRTVDELELSIMVGEATMVDFSDLPEGRSVDLSLIQTRLSGKIPERLVIRYDWSKHWGRSSFYENHPYLEPDAAKWLVDGGLKIVLMDTPMPDNPADGKGSAIDSPIHKIFLNEGVVIVEYLTNLDKINATTFEIVCLPLKIREGDGSPVRCIAIID